MILGFEGRLWGRMEGKVLDISRIKRSLQALSSECWSQVGAAGRCWALGGEGG